MFSVSIFRYFSLSWTDTMLQLPKQCSEYCYTRLPPELCWRLHWLPVHQWLTYKLEVLTCKTWSTSITAYLSLGPTVFHRNFCQIKSASLQNCLISMAHCSSVFFYKML